MIRKLILVSLTLIFLAMNVFSLPFNIKYSTSMKASLDLKGGIYKLNGNSITVFNPLNETIFVKYNSTTFVLYPGQQVSFPYRNYSQIFITTVDGKINIIISING
jgi:hypothetical protein